MEKTEQKILTVDDEPKLIRLVREVLTATGYKVYTTGNGREAIELVALEKPDLVLLDIVLTGEINGFDVARRVREFSDIPIIMLTAKARESDVLRGFDAGADDYIIKPFSSKELLARVRAVLKRAQEAGGMAVTEMICGALHIDLARRRVVIHGEGIHLTRTEYNLLRELAVHRNQVLLHTQLLTAVWGAEYRDDLDYLRAYIRYLRRKLEPDPSSPQYIVTYQGVGYMLACPEES
ncbi:MAG: response regulator transcription factor [Anaerolineales bacterium]|nr:response regulator transcription factor [Anaerolineales bacterium]MCB0026297.1 response regulator transcription factor [Anaerolineales bacterium]